MADLIALLKDRADRSLANPAKVTDGDIAAAVAESNDLCGGRKVIDAARLDIAYFRLKLRLKSEIDETDETLYKRALEIVRSSPIEGAGNSAYNGVAAVKQRDNRWAL
jgi:hypothetical protein